MYLKLMSFLNKNFGSKLLQKGFQVKTYLIRIQQEEKVIKCFFESKNK